MRRRDDADDRWSKGWRPVPIRPHAGPTPVPSGYLQCAGDPGCPYRLRGTVKPGEKLLCRWHRALRTAPAHWLTVRPVAEPPEQRRQRRRSGMAQLRADRVRELVG